MWTYRVGCAGTELRLDQCPHPGFSRFTRYRCPGRKRSAGVICTKTKLRPPRVPRRGPWALTDAAATPGLVRGRGRGHGRGRGRHGRRHTIRKTTVAPATMRNQKSISFP